MAEPPDDRVNLDEQLIIAADARYGGLYCRWKFHRVFHPHRVLALLHRVEDADHALHVLEEEWGEQCTRLQAQVARVQALAVQWRSEGDTLAADELEAALKDVKPAPAA